MDISERRAREALKSTKRGNVARVGRHADCDVSISASDLNRILELVNFFRDKNTQLMQTLEIEREHLKLYLTETAVNQILVALEQYKTSMIDKGLVDHTDDYQDLINIIEQQKEEQEE